MRTIATFVLGAIAAAGWMAACGNGLPDKQDEKLTARYPFENRKIAEIPEGHLQSHSRWSKDGKNAWTQVMRRAGAAQKYYLMENGKKVSDEWDMIVSGLPGQDPNTLTYLANDRRKGWSLFVGGRETRLDVPSQTFSLGAYLSPDQKKVGYFVQDKNAILWRVQDVN